MARLSAQAKRRFGIEITVRVRVHRGLVYLDTAQDDVYGLAANLAARVSGLAQPGSVVVSGAVEPLVRKAFEVEARPAAAVKPDLPLAHRDPDIRRPLHRVHHGQLARLPAGCPPIGGHRVHPVCGPVGGQTRPVCCSTVGTSPEQTGEHPK